MPSLNSNATSDYMTRHSHAAPTESLAQHLAAWVAAHGASLKEGSASRTAVATTVSALARAIIEIADLLSLGALAGPFGAATGKWGGTDPQRALDVMANTEIVNALKDTPVARLISEELDDPLPLADGGCLTVAIDPLDGASNADTNAAIGTIFSVFAACDPDASVGQTLGSKQLAAGFAVYGPQIVLVLTLGAGTHIFTLHPRTRMFVVTALNVAIPPAAPEFAINAANHFHWDEPIRSYVESCLRGRDGVATGDTGTGSVGATATGHNMRWTGSFVAEVYRILIRGGVYLYPGDARPAFRNGRLRLAYEACPVAFIVEQAGGTASTGRGRVLDVPIMSWHQRTPLIAGSSEQVAHVERLHADPYPVGERSPLFGRRGLFRV